MNPIITKVQYTLWRAYPNQDWVECWTVDENKLEWLVDRKNSMANSFVTVKIVKQVINEEEQ